MGFGNHFRLAQHLVGGLVGVEHHGRQPRKAFGNEALARSDTPEYSDHALFQIPPGLRENLRIGDLHLQEKRP